MLERGVLVRGACLGDRPVAGERRCHLFVCAYALRRRPRGPQVVFSSACHRKGADIEEEGEPEAEEEVEDVGSPLEVLVECRCLGRPEVIRTLERNRTLGIALRSPRSS